MKNLKTLQRENKKMKKKKTSYNIEPKLVSGAEILTTDQTL